MREFDRIDRITNLFNKAWKEYPDLRFFQLVECFAIQIKQDEYYLEDTEFEKMLKEFIEREED